MRTLLLIVLAMMLAAPSAAQTGPDYAILNIRPAQLSADGTEVLVVFDVTNQGSTASTIATVRIVNEASQEEVTSKALDPLIAEESKTVILRFPVELLTPDKVLTLRITVGLDEIEPSSGDVSNNIATIVVPPLNEMDTLPAPTPAPVSSGPAAFLQQLGFNTEDPVHMIALAGIILALGMILVLLLVILRLLIRRRPRFELFTPPYANVPPMAPSTNAGRRQGWQFHAQNDQPPYYPADAGATHIRKLLIGMDGTKMGNWDVTGMRMNQYDQYGRIARSEVVAARKHCHSLSKIAEKAPTLNEEQVSRRVRPVARAFVSQFRRKINARSAILPIALDIAFEGVHGEVRIRFELYYLEQGRWRMVDSWEPEMTVAARAIHENYTYSLNGLRQGEAFHTFTRRLQDDLTILLTDMLKHDLPDTGASRPVDHVQM